MLNVTADDPDDPETLLNLPSIAASYDFAPPSFLTVPATGLPETSAFKAVPSVMVNSSSFEIEIVELACVS